jgi:Ca2+-binding RTX toxin-like protein
MNSRGRFATLGAAAATALALSTGPAGAATVTVNSGVDEGAGIVNGLCSIREAIDEAQANGPQAFNPDCVFDLTQPYGDDTINLPAGMTHSLTGPNLEDFNDSGDLDVTVQSGNALMIAGAGPTSVIDANDNDRVINFGGSGNGVLSNLTITDGTSPAIEAGGGVRVNLNTAVTLSGVTVTGNHSPNIGGGVHNSGTLTVIGSTINGNTTSTTSGNGGAGVASTGSTTISGSTVSGNTITSPDDASNGSGVSGGGLMQASGGTMTVLDTTIASNTINSLDATKFPSGAGVGVSNGDLTLRRTLLTGNIAGGGTASGGAVSFEDDTANNTVVVENSTLSGNAASSVGSQGGAIVISKGVMQIANATFTNNTSTFGRAVYYRQSFEPASSVTARGSIFQEDNGNECASPTGDLTSAGYNIDRNVSCGLAGTGDQQNTTVSLGSLASNGGPTQTHALLSGSNGIDDIPQADCDDTAGDPLTSDQRGAPRPQGSVCDIGAFERGPDCNGLASTILGTGSGETIAGTAGVDVIVAGDGADTVNAGDGADTVCGGNGDDTIRGGTGGDADNLNGEGNADALSFSDLTSGVTAASLAAGTTSGTDVGSDTVSNFENIVGSDSADGTSSPLNGNSGPNTIDGGPGNDTIQGAGGADTLIGGGNSGGSGDTASWLNSGSLNPITASLVTNTATGEGSDTLSGFESLTGGSGDDVLTGDGGPNTLNGFNGDDTLEGLDGSDVFIGSNNGAAGDTVSFAGLPNGVIASLGPVVGVIGATGQGTDTGNSIENLTGSPSGDDLGGDAAANAISGGNGNDTLADGATTIANPDTFGGGDGTDTVSYAARTSAVGPAVTVNLNLTTDNGGAPTENDDVGADIEGAAGGAAADSLVGDEQANALSGGGEDDTLDGRDGADTINGQGGFDAATYLNQAGPVTANLTTGVASGAQGADGLNSVETLVGSPDGDTLTGNATGNVLFGQGGNDTLDGRETNDLFEGGGGTDTASFAGLPSGVQATLTAGTLSATGGQGNDSGTSLENLTGSDAADTLTGDDNANVITGGLGADIVFANAGPDALLIRDGVGDTADCGSDADTDTVETDQQGTDTLTNCGSDTIQFPSAPPPPGGGGPISPPAPQGSCAGRTLTLTGTEGNDTITGTAAADVIAALGGNDTVRGLAGNDVVCGGTGNDRLIGGAGNDRLLGEAGKDTLKGSAGRDNCSGAGGRDTAATCERRRSVP